MKYSMKILAACILFLWLYASLIMPVAAADYTYDGAKDSNYENAWQDMLDTLPESIRDEMREYSIHPEQNTSGRYLSLAYWWEKIKPALFSAAQNVIQLMASLYGILLITAIIHQWTGSAAEGCFQFCSDICVALSLFETVQEILSGMHLYLTEICGTMTAMVPVMTMIQYSAGEISTASVNRISMSLFITVLTQLQKWIFLPLGQALCGLSIMSAVCTQISLGGFTGGVKKCLMTLFSFLVLVYSFIYGLQTTLARSADSLGLRAVKFAMGSFIPIVGGTVSEAFSAVREGLGYVKIMTGTGGIIVLCLMILPIAATVWSFDLVLACCHSGAEFLECKQSARIFADTRSVIQIFAAILWLSTVFFLFSIILFTKTTGQTG